MVKISEDIRMVARESAERIVRSGKRRNEFGSLSVRTEEAQIEDWTTGILGEMVFQKVLQDQGIEVGPVNLSVMPKGDGGSDFKVVILDGEIRTLRVPLDVKAVRLGSWLLIPESSFRKEALYALVSVGHNEGDIEGMAFGWMFQDNDGNPYFRIPEGDYLPRAMDASIAYWQGLKRARTRLKSRDMFPEVYLTDFKLKTTNLGLPKQALLTESYNWAWALEKASE